MTANAMDTKATPLFRRLISAGFRIPSVAVVDVDRDAVDDEILVDEDKSLREESIVLLLSTRKAGDDEDFRWSGITSPN